MSQPRVSGLPLGKVAGADVRIGASWLLLAAVLVAVLGPQLAANRPDLGAGAYVVAVGYALLLLGSVLIHEIAHAVVAQRAGQTVHTLKADLFGGHTSFDATGLTPGRAAAIAVAGPAANGALGLLGLAVDDAMGSDIPGLLVYACGVANLYLAGFNLLPGLPLDGGQLVESAVWAVTGQRRLGTQVAGYLGLVVAAGVAVWWVVMPLSRGEETTTTLLIALPIAYFLARGAVASIVRGRVLRRLDAIRLEEVLDPVTPVRSDLPSMAAPPGRLVVVGPGGEPIGLVDPRALAEVPADRRDRTPVSALAVRPPAGWVVEATSDELTPVAQAMASRELPVALIVRDGRLLGLLDGARLNELLH